jgi:hypothetical protein
LGDFERTNSGLFIWEALVMVKAKGESHHIDAGIAVNTFISCVPHLEQDNTAEENIVYSLIGAALLRTR